MRSRKGNRSRYRHSLDDFDPEDRRTYDEYTDYYREDWDEIKPVSLVSTKRKEQLRSRKTEHSPAVKLRDVATRKKSPKPKKTCLLCRCSCTCSLTHRPRCNCQCSLCGKSSTKCNFLIARKDLNQRLCRVKQRGVEFITPDINEKIRLATSLMENEKQHCTKQALKRKLLREENKHKLWEEAQQSRNNTLSATGYYKTSSSKARKPLCYTW